MIRKLAAALAVFLVFGLSGEAAAEISVFHSPSDDGVADQETLDPNSSLTLYLYITNPGSLSSGGTTVCIDGDGRELCGYDLALEASGDIQFQSFTPTPDLSYQPGATRLRLNAVEAVNGVDADTPLRIGELAVQTGNDPGTVMLSAGKALDASLNVVTLQPVTLVPEPGLPVLLACGIPALSLLARRRKR